MKSTGVKMFNDLKNEREIWLWFFILVVIAYFLSGVIGCNTLNKPDQSLVLPVINSPIPRPTVTPIAVTVSYPQKGWISDYDDYIKGMVTERMLNQPNIRMTQFCDAWPTMNVDQKKQMYADLLYSIAYPESNYNNLNIYLESTMSKDELTGLPTMSEGMEQLSYQDTKTYGSGCAFDWKKDYKNLKDDIDHGRSYSAHPERDTLNPYLNLKCAMTIIDFHLKISSKEFADSLAQYWYTMNRKHGEDYSMVWSKMRERRSVCH